MNKKIYVTKPSLPEIKELIPYLEKIWNSRILTNNGPFHQEFEEKLAKFLGVKYVSLFCNGTSALQVGLQALRITGEVVTTPYTFAATTHAIYWNRCTPVFCDINEDDFNIDPDKIESLITPNTTAILPVHVYGNPCKMKKIQKIADTYGLKVFYDAAHAFGVEKDSTSILNWGDLSMLSFHATKVFNTFEGGALITNDKKLKERIDFLKNFGFADEVTVIAPGSNAKMDELRSAIGLLQLKHINNNIDKRRIVAKYYKTKFKEVNGIQYLKDLPKTRSNYSYFPILIDSIKLNKTRDELYNKLKSNNIYARKYFYPLISSFPSYNNLPSASISNLPTAERIAKGILCLPIHHDLTIEELDKIINLILD
ncbi:MAG TPA: DegT/DnrJ/EryC1/StrS family aminotransferase [Victivallales bacterium]|nr:DegT/DnrJ/EryC1/StrS family aminotransferase [Victivallales bacterium]